MYSTSCAILSKKMASVKEDIDRSRRDYACELGRQKSASYMVRQKTVDIMNQYKLIRDMEMKIKELKRQNVVLKKERTKFESEARKSKIRMYKESLKIKNREDYLMSTQKVFQEMQGRIKDRNAGIDLKVLTKRLPTDILSNIREFLPYNIQYQLLDQRYKPFALMRKMDLQGCHILWCNIVDNPLYLVSELLKHGQEKMNELATLRKRLSYGGYVFYSNTSILMDILKRIYLMKDSCPEEALKFLRKICMIIDSKKEYNVKHESMREIARNV